ncbi:Ig-like protein [Catenovulum agarivorans DS-2]|uniref:Ig-like protein n=1 Tax=Catenovulum agarivorans DS-2 TaxID=1328313 RepID=W7QMR8_9ALTE|nr:Ig-like domain-containing protein [Catenovulum agarivorans]EWH09213.1 Ig-like protein [Catenovulum agarivorans DS-2]
MKHNLLFKTATAIAVVSALSACKSDVEEGYNANFISDEPVTFDSEQILTESYTENSGLKTIDLLAGAMVGDKPAAEFTGNLAIRQIEMAVDKNFLTPQSESNSLNNLTISPFVISQDGRSLEVDTDKFAESLRFCDNTDKRGGGKDSDGNPIADGFPDFPKSVTYTISYEVNNGYTYSDITQIPRRTLQLTMNAATDPVTSVSIADVSVPVGGSSQASAATAPTYACESGITYSIADTSIATVDANTGVVTGVKRGTTTITATSVDGGHTATAEVTVTAGFTLAITNGEKDDLGAYTGKKSVPACSKSAVVVEPQLEIPGKELTGEYTFDFESSNTTDFTFESALNYGFGQTAMFTPGAIGTKTNVTASYSTGETHGVPASAIADQAVELTVVDNVACHTTNPADGTTYDFDYAFEHDTMLNSDTHVKVSTANNSTRWVPLGTAASVSTAIGEGIAGSNAIKVIVKDADFNDPIKKDGFGTLLQRWNSSTASWTASNFGRPAFIGKTFKFSVWVKLPNKVAEGEQRSMTNFMFTWKTADDTTYHSADEYNSWARRHAPFNMQLTQPLANTTDWQQVEFGEFTIPAEWDALPQVIKFGFEFEGAFANGDEMIIDDLSVVEVN